jgi:hypothetical protein
MSFKCGFAAALAAALVSGCASFGAESLGADPYALAPIAAQLTRADAVGDCARRFRDLDARIDSAGARDAQDVRVPGYPYLRVDRLLEHLAQRQRNGDAAAERTWLELAAARDASARTVESANASRSLDTALDACRERLHADARSIAGAPSAQSLAEVPDRYSTALRALGMYPLTRLAFAAGIRGWHRETLEQFAVPVNKLPERGPRMIYAPAQDAPADVPTGWVAPAQAAALGLPALSAEDAIRLLHQNAPSIAVETASDDDWLGQLVWTTPTQIGVDTRRPAAYARIAYAALGARVHVQLIYTFWFPARPAVGGFAGSFDVLAGPLDGLIWRVTLDRDMRTPLLYDTIHPCGCYHLFFPADKLRARTAPPPEQGRFDEGLFVPQAAPPLAAGQRLQILLESRTHYVQRLLAVVGTAAASAQTYTLLDENALRALPHPAGGTRSAYGEDGLIAGSERTERFFFWPMGIASAGQMRQWGHHATAFVGRRHFDDPRLLERYFESPPGAD